MFSGMGLSVLFSADECATYGAVVGFSVVTLLAGKAMLHLLIMLLTTADAVQSLVMHRYSCVFFIIPLMLGRDR